LQQEIGYALAENIVADEQKGKMLNADFANYMVLTSLDMPKVEIGLSEPIDPTGPFGAKGTSAPSILGVAPAIAHAIYDAIGIRFSEIPMTPEKVFRALISGKGHSDLDRKELK
jgi:xanthine dehydrogenase molybdenum-binding subunit